MKKKPIEYDNPMDSPDFDWQNYSAAELDRMSEEQSDDRKAKMATKQKPVPNEAPTAQAIELLIGKLGLIEDELICWNQTGEELSDTLKDIRDALKNIADILADRQ